MCCLEGKNDQKFENIKQPEIKLINDNLNNK